MNTDYIKYIENEIQVLQKLNHPNILKMVDDVYLKKSSVINERDEVIVISDLAEESLDSLIQKK